mgnify:CR=1 FL=1
MADPLRKRAVAATPSGKRATYADLEAAPPELVAEIIDGQLVTHRRPARAGIAATALGSLVTHHFQKETGNWVFLPRPELHFGEHVLVPDCAGYHRGRLAGLEDVPHLEIVPEWVCEVLTPETVRVDRTAKRRIYGEAGVGHLWLVDPRHQLLEAFVLTDGRWALAGTWTGADAAAAPPFEAISISLADLWPLDRPLGFAENPQPLLAGDR